jgi:hypothetical protein
MSRTKRPPTGPRADFYETPESAVDVMLLDLAGMIEATRCAHCRTAKRRTAGRYRFLDAGSGGGAIGRVVLKHFPKSSVRGIEFDAARVEEAKAAACPFPIVQGDFLALELAVDDRPEVVISNPPFSQWIAFAEKSLALVASGGHVALLGRLGLLESAARYSFWQNHAPKAVLVLSKRPSFTGGGSDASAYGWFVWGPWDERRGTIEVLPPSLDHTFVGAQFAARNAPRAAE